MRLVIVVLCALGLVSSQYLVLQGIGLLSHPIPLQFLTAFLVAVISCASYLHYLFHVKRVKAIFASTVAIIVAIVLDYILVQEVLEAGLRTIPALSPLTRSGAFTFGVMSLLICILLNILGNPNIKGDWLRLLSGILLSLALLIFLEYLALPLHRGAGDAAALDLTLSTIYVPLIWGLITMILSSKHVAVM